MNDPDNLEDIDQKLHQIAGRLDLPAAGPCSIMARGQRRRRRHHVVLAASVGASLAVLGLGTAVYQDEPGPIKVSSPSQGSADPDGFPTIDRVTSIDPISDLADRNRTAPAYANAFETLVAQCMTAKGWQYEPALQTEGHFSGDGTRPTNPAALVQYREQYGYGYLNEPPQAAETGRAATDRQGDYEARLTPQQRQEYLADLGSHPENGRQDPPGCREEADATVRRSQPVVDERIINEVLQLEGHVLKVEPYQTASSRWAECMAGEGFSFSEPNVAQASIAALFMSSPQTGAVPGPRTPDARALEIRTATADAHCSLNTVWPVQAQLFGQLVQAMMDKYGREAVCGGPC
jgi:hypothetical protein